MALALKKKKIILISSIVAITSITTAIVVPVVVIKQQNDDKQKKQRDEFINLKSKFDKIDLNLVLSDKINLNVAESHQKIKDSIFKKFENDNIKLSNSEKDSIKILTNKGTISQIAYSIIIRIEIANYKKDYTFKVKRTKSQNENNIHDLQILEQKLEKLEKEIILETTKDLNLNKSLDRKTTKDDFIKQISKKIKLSDDEIKAISVEKAMKIISYSKYNNININMIFGQENSSIVFKLKRTKSQAEIDISNFNILKAKVDKIDLNYTLIDENDLDLSIPNIQQRIINFIFDKIDAKNKDNKLTQIEKNTISLITKDIVITHTDAKDVIVRIKIGTNIKNYTFEIKRTKDKDEIAFYTLREKIFNIDLNQIFTFDDDADITIDSSTWKKLKDFIIDEIDKLNSGNELTTEEKKAITLITTSGTINTNPLNTEIQIAFGSNNENYSFRLTRTKTNLEKLNSLKTKVDKVDDKQIFILADENDLDLSIEDNREKIKEKIIIVIDLANSDKLSIEEKNAISITTDSGTIKKDNPINVVVRIAFDSETEDYTFKFKRAKSNAEKLTILKGKVDKVNLTQTHSDQVDIDLSTSANQTKIKNFILSKIDASNSGNELSQEEKDAITLITTSGTITHSTSLNIEVQIAFDSKRENYIFKLTRTKNSDELKIWNVKNKIEKIDQNLEVDSMKDLDLTNVTDMDDIREFIIRKINSLNNGNPLEEEEKNLISIKRESKKITHTFKTIIMVRISSGSAKPLVKQFHLTRMIKKQELFDEIKLIWGRITHYLYQKKKIKYTWPNPKDPSTWNFPPIPAFDFTWNELFPGRKRQNHASQWLNINYKRKIFLRKFIKIMFEINDSYTKKFLPPEWKQGSDSYNWLPSQWRDAIKLEKDASWMIDCFLPEGTIWTNTYYDWINGKKVLKHDSYGTRNFYIFIDAGSIKETINGKRVTKNLKIQYQYLINMKLPKAV